jgi:hypothetical protein
MGSTIYMGGKCDIASMNGKKWNKNGISMGI